MTGLSANYPCLNSRAVFITGGATGIGAGLVTHFARQGARVGFADIDKDAADQLIASVNGDVTFVECNVLDIPALRHAIDTFQNQCGTHISVLVNNAGRDSRHDLEDLEPDDWDDLINVNLRHQYFASQAVLPGMKQAGGGSIINLGSTVVAMSAGNMAAYVSAKAGVHGLTRALARDMGKFRIRVNCILPGWIMTPRQLDYWYDDTSEAKIVENQCLPDKLTPDDVAAMALFLAADDSRNCTAQSFVVDGGWT